MKQLSTSTLARISNSCRTVDRGETIQKVTRLSRLSSTMEPLESRTLMSAGTLTLPTPPLLSASKAATTKVSVISTKAVVAKAAPKPVAKTTAKSDAPPGTPTSLSATAPSRTQMKLSWTDSPTGVSGYDILRSNDGIHFSQVGKLASATAGTFTDTGLASGQAYKYEVQAFSSTTTSAPSAVATGVTPLAAPSKLAVTVTSSSQTHLTWVDNDASATGYNVLRSTDGIHFSQLSKLSTGAANSVDDKTALPFTKYYYQIQATTAEATSPASNIASATTPLAAPTNLIANGSSGTSVLLTWTDTNPSAGGYAISRSTDGIHFTALTKLSTGTATSYTDTTVTRGQKYYYEIAATAGTNTSAVSNIATVSLASEPVSPTPTPGTTTTVSITTRYSDELVITAAGTADKVSVTQSGATLTIVANGQTTTQPAPAAGLFIYTRGGKDGINVDKSVTVPTTIETIDTGADSITSQSADVSVWDDSGDVFTGTGTVHTVAAFAGGVSKATGASLPDPKDSGTIMQVSASLWGTGPVAGDVNQGESGDCYFLSSLAAFAGVEPAMLQQSAVDMGDGTYTVDFIANNKPEYIRVSNDLPTQGSESYVYARPGSTGSIWAAIMEKAYAFFRTGANTYASISSGWMGDVYTALGVNNSFFYMNSMSQSALYNRLSADLAKGRAVTLGTSSNAPNLVSGHAYTLISASIDKNGSTTYVVRNPWGISGDSLENSQGYATLTFAQMQANFQDGCEATS